MNATTKPAAQSDDENKTVVQLTAEIAVLAGGLATADSAKEEEILAGIRSKKARIAKLNESREIALKDMEQNIAMFGFKLSELSEATRAILGARAAGAGGSAASAAEGEKKKNQRAAEVDFGLIPFADFGFKPAKTADKALHFKVNKMYGPTENGEFLKIVRAEVMKKGAGILDKYMSDSFKAWIAEFKEGEGPKKGQKLYLNKRDFMSYWNLKEDGSIDEKGTKALPDGITVASLAEAAKKAKK